MYMKKLVLQKERYLLTVSQVHEMLNIKLAYLAHIEYLIEDKSVICDALTNAKSNLNAKVFLRALYSHTSWLAKMLMMLA